MQEFKRENLKSWDLLGYIESVTCIKAKKAGNNTYKFQTCPICGGGDHFTVNTIKNYWNTWSNCGGGTIVDFYMGYYGVSQMDAITALLGNDSIMKESQRLKEKRNEKPTASPRQAKTVDLTKNILEHYIKYTGDRDRLYFYRRNLPDWIIEKYKLFCCNPKEVFPSDLLPQLTNIDCWEYIIPVWRGNKAVNAIIRRNDNKTQYGEKAYNLKGLGLEIINADYVNQEHKLVCITEGIFDALSLETLGFNAICLNSANMADRLLKLIKLGNRVNKYFIFGDNDNAGKELNNKISNGLASMNIQHVVFDAYKGDYDTYKDINLFHCCEDVQKLKDNIKKCFYQS
jgi:5S rRNA maturation endonuclease (ribonuclease M5)